MSGEQGGGRERGEEEELKKKNRTGVERRDRE